MEMQKIENLLLTSFEVTEEQREKSPELLAGYDKESKRWEVAIRYINNLNGVLEDFPEVKSEFLIGNYAILSGNREDLIEIATRDEVLYMEAAKRLFFSWEKEVNEDKINKMQLEQSVTGLESICLTRTIRGENPITGKGVYTAYLDTGIDYRHPEFIDEKGESRIAFIWDQTMENGFYTHEQIQRALELSIEEGDQIIAQRDLSGHGTHVAAIGSGNSGVAPGSEILIVKLGTPTGGGAKTTELMRGVDACVRYAVENKRALALNISYGTNYGAHNGYGVLEQYLQDAMGYGRNVFCVGAGNEGVGNSHFTVSIEEIREQQGIQQNPYLVELAVGEYQQGFSLQIWKEYQENIRIYLRPAGVSNAVELREELTTVSYTFAGMEALVYYGEPSPFSRYQEVYIDFIPEDDFLPDGIWEIYLEHVGESSGGTDIDMWIPVSETLAAQTGFLRSSPETTLTIPATTVGVITVGAYDQRFDQPTAFSGRGYTWATNQIKPDLVAPGVAIVSASPGGGYVTRTGSSMATPFVTGSAAMLMEWGIVLENDSYLYGEKIKAYLIKGARKLPGIEVYPNPQIGWGALCIRESV